jgi:hypothetical protein
MLKGNHSRGECPPTGFEADALSSQTGTATMTIPNPSSARPPPDKLVAAAKRRYQC